MRSHVLPDELQERGFQHWSVLANVPPLWQLLPEVGYDVEEPENGLQSISQLLLIVGGENTICLFLTHEPTHPRGVYSVSIVAPHTEFGLLLLRSIGMVTMYDSLSTHSCFPLLLQK